MMVSQRFKKNFTVDAALAAGGTKTINISFDDRQQYAPFNYLRIHNVSGQDLLVYVSEDISNPDPVYAGNIGEIDPTENRQFHTISLKNNSAAVTDAAITIEIGAFR